jgi:hypothetical protein
VVAVAAALRQVRELVGLAEAPFMAQVAAVVVVAAQLQTMALAAMEARVLFCLFTRCLQQPPSLKDQSLDKKTK